MHTLKKLGNAARQIALVASELQDSEKLAPYAVAVANALIGSELMQASLAPEKENSRDGSEVFCYQYAKYIDDACGGHYSAGM